MKAKHSLLVLMTACTTGLFAQMTVSKSNAVFGPFFKMINTSQEVKIAPRLTVQTTVRTRPTTEFSFGRLGTIRFDGQDYTPFGKTTLSCVGNVSEFRIYKKDKGAFHGFYWGPYFTYTHFKLKSASVHATFHDNDGVAYYGDVSHVVRLNVTGGGFQIGTQGMYFKNHMAIDWTILGIGLGWMRFEGGLEAENTSDNFDFRNYPNDVANMQMGIERVFHFKRDIQPTSITIGAGLPFPIFRMGVSIGVGYGGSWHFGKKNKDKKNDDQQNNGSGSPQMPQQPQMPSGGNWR